MNRVIATLVLAISLAAAAVAGAGVASAHAVRVATDPVENTELNPRVDGAVVSVGVRPLGPSGTYTVNYRVTSADGHVVSGSWSFKLTVSGTGTPGPSASATTPSSDGIPVWPFFVAAGLIVTAGAVWTVRRQR